MALQSSKVALWSALISGASTNRQRWALRVPEPLHVCADRGSDLFARHRARLVIEDHAGLAVDDLNFRKSQRGKNQQRNAGDYGDNTLRRLKLLPGFRDVLRTS